jgi:hypothetical protein
MKQHPIYDTIKRRHDSYTNDWAEQARKDPEIGGQHFDKTVRKAKAVIHRFGTAALKQELNESGLGNHPELVRFIWKIAQELERNSTNSGSNQQPKDWGKIFYPNFPNP